MRSFCGHLCAFNREVARMLWIIRVSECVNYYIGCRNALGMTVYMCVCVAGYGRKGERWMEGEMLLQLAILKDLGNCGGSPESYCPADLCSCSWKWLTD